MQENRTTNIIKQLAVTFVVFILLFSMIFFTHIFLRPPHGYPMYVKVEEDLKTLQAAADIFTLICQRPPTSMDEFLSPPKRRNGDELEPFLEELPRDPWDNPYRLVVDMGDCTFQCAGEDGVFGTEDDISINNSTCSFPGRS